MEQVATAENDEEDRDGKCCGMVDDLASPDIKSREKRDHNG